MFWWRYLSEGESEAGRSEAFGTREDAERWIAETWSDLLDEGVLMVALVDDDDGAEVYRMGLGAAEG